MAKMVAFYGYGGFGFDINFAGKWVITPTAAVGYFSHGNGNRFGTAALAASSC
jgi:hypothetical protein